jgi:methionine aminotransferase
MENLYKDKLPGIGTSIFAVMSGLAAKTGAVNLSQGFPDFEVSKELIDSVYKYLRDGKNQYAPMPGILPLRQVLSEKIYKLYQARFNPETEITVTAGATQALFTAIQAFVSKGDEVIIFEPAYDSYVPSVLLAGGKPVFIRLTKPYFKIDWNEVKNKITDKTRLIILNTPNNPGGYIWSENDWKNLEDLTKNTRILILSDEVYEHIIFDGFRHESGLKHPGLRHRLMSVFSFGKTFHATGWKTGYVVSHETLMKLFRKVHQFNVFSVNTPIQYALADYLKNENNYSNLPAFYQAKRDYFINGIKNSRWKIIPTHGTYFILLDYSEISDEKEFDFAVKLTRETGVASIPLSSFYHDKYEQTCLRFCFAKKKSTLDQAIELLRNV